MLSLLFAVGLTAPTDTLDFVPEPERRRASVNDVFFHVFRPNQHDWQQLGDAGAVPRWGGPYAQTAVVAVDPTVPTMVYTHGFKSKGVKSGRAIAEAMQWCYERGGATGADRTRCNKNLIIVDWSSLADIAQWTRTFPTVNYDQPKQNVPAVGRRVYDMLVTFNRQHGLRWADYHLVGHSLGSHISGYVARYVGQEPARTKIPHLTALDPAGPGFVNSNTADGRNPSYSTDVQHVGKTDATYVDVWHTNGKEGPTYVPHNFGDLNPLGHADFYISGGRQQPNCSKTFGKCSHTRAKDLYAMAIEDPDKIAAWLCTNQGGNLDGCAVPLGMGTGCLGTGGGCLLNWDNVEWEGDWFVPGASSATGGPWTYLSQCETGGTTDGEGWRNPCTPTAGSLPYNPTAGFTTSYQNCRPYGNWITGPYDPNDRDASDSDGEDPDDDTPGSDSRKTLRYAVN